MKNIAFILFLFFSSVAFACDCEPKNSSLEFHNAAYVFEGTVISKVYAEDKQTYTATFQISKHYKNSEKPSTISFVLTAEEKFTKIATSCDWSVKEGEKWLVYAHKNNNNQLSFDGICSNSRRIDTTSLSKDCQLKLDLGNTFSISDYIYQGEYGFTNTKPKTDINTALQKARKKNYKNVFTVIKFYINEHGKLHSVSVANQFHFLLDSIFKMPKDFVAKKMSPRNSFEKEALRVARQIKDWEIKYHKKTNTPVRYIKSVIFTYDLENNSWNYEL